MSTNAQIQANRQNATTSTGPKTDAGKSASSQNSFRHGLAGSAIKMLEGENIQDFLDLANGVIREHKPVTMTEDVLVTKMVQSLWLGRRAINLQESLLRANSPDKQLFALYLRYQTTHDRAFSKSLNDLQAFRKEARRREVGFVSQGQKKELHEAKIRGLNARSETLEYALILRKSHKTAVMTPVQNETGHSSAHSRHSSSKGK